MDELRLEASVEKLDAVLAFVDERLEALDCPMKAQMQLDIAVEEIYVNIASYAYAPGTGDAAIRFETERDPLTVVITFFDSGKPYDPLAREDPDVTLAAEDREIGGLGVYMVKKSMDAVEYEYRNRQNILRIKKIIG